MSGEKGIDDGLNVVMVVVVVDSTLSTTVSQCSNVEFTMPTGGSST